MIAPETFKSLYRMIAFTNIPYNIALEKSLTYEFYIKNLLLLSGISSIGLSILVLKKYFIK